LAFKSYEESVNCFFTKDIGPTNDIIDRQDEIRRLYLKITPMPTDIDFEASQIIHVISIRENIMNIGSLSADIAELIIDRASEYGEISK
jgi:hypothetical protein